MAPSEAFYQAVERRIELLIVVVTCLGAAIAGVYWGWHVAIGVAAGGALSWLNFRWLDQTVGALLGAAAGSAAGPASVPRWIYARFLGRVILLVGMLYAILKLRWLPGRAVLAGFFSLILAVILEVSYEAATGFREPDSPV
jgi:hypothetical protein